jgi:23S rRNA (cytosine1962-C5)-methyltransferase
MPFPHLKLKKGEDRRIRKGHPWIFSNEVDTKATPFSLFTAGDQIIVEAHDKSLLGLAYINPHSLICARLLSNDPQETLSVNFFKSRIEQALYLRERVFKQAFYRLIYGEADALPGLIIDRFQDHLVLQINTAGMERHLSLIQEAILASLPNTSSILLRNDSPIREQEGLSLSTSALYGAPPEKIMLEENQVTFAIPLWQGQKTGWFYDHRQNRARLAHYVSECRVLDVFSYLGAWGIQAGVYGAKQVDFIEQSQTACEFIKENAAHNHIQEKVNIICKDAFEALKDLAQQQKKYDVIILDPPAFVKKSKDYKEGLLAYQRINELALKLLAHNGILISCSCSMHISMNDLVEMMQRLQYRSECQLQLLEYGHQGPDHPIHIAIPETHYLKALVMRKIKY